MLRHSSGRRSPQAPQRPINSPLQVSSPTTTTTRQEHRHICTGTFSLHRQNCFYSTSLLSLCLSVCLSLSSICTPLLRRRAASDISFVCIGRPVVALLLDGTSQEYLDAAAAADCMPFWVSSMTRKEQKVMNVYAPLSQRPVSAISIKLNFP